MSNNYDPEYIKLLFNKMSGSYERVNYITSFGFSLRWRRQFLRNLNKGNDQIEIIDLMTGMGETWASVKKSFPNSDFTALDFSDGMIKKAKEKNQKFFQNKITVLQQNILENQLISNSYDMVLSAFGLKTFNDEQLEKLAYEVKRILKPGGEFSFIEVSEPKNIILKSLYKLHLKYVVPFCGWMLLGNPSEYRMLWRYTHSYGNSQNVSKIFKNAGLVVNEVSYFGGCATGITGYKKA